MTHHTDSLGRPMPLDAHGLLIPDAAAAQEADARRQLEAVYRANYTGGPLVIAKTEPAPSLIESAHLERLPRRYRRYLEMVHEWDTIMARMDEKVSPDFLSATRDIARSS